MRVVVDTSVPFAGLRSSRGAAHAVLRGCLAGSWRAVVSVPLAAEYEEVILRPELRRGTDLTLEDLDQFLDGFLAAAHLVAVYFLWRPNLRDADDDLVVEAAVAGNASAIITHNVADFLGGGLRFPGIDVITPARFLAAGRGESS